MTHHIAPPLTRDDFADWVFEYHLASGQSQKSHIKRIVAVVWPGTDTLRYRIEVSGSEPVEVATLDEAMKIYNEA